jgi:hypothetical protein
MAGVWPEDGQEDGHHEEAVPQTKNHCQQKHLTEKKYCLNVDKIYIYMQ